MTGEKREHPPIDEDKGAHNPNPNSEAEAPAPAPPPTTPTPPLGQLQQPLLLLVLLLPPNQRKQSLPSAKAVARIREPG